LRALRGQCAWIAALALLLLTLGGGARAGAEADGKPKSDGKPESNFVPGGAPPTEEQRQKILKRVLSHPRILQGNAGHRLKGLRITLGTIRASGGQTKAVAMVVLFDHTAGEASRVLLDTVTGDVLSADRLPGRPQGSPEEFEEAVKIVRADSVLAPVLEAGGVLDGGFIVDDRGGSRRRLMQLKLLSADRQSTLRTIHVDLTRGTIASVAVPPSVASLGAVPGAPANAEGAER
jgi:hypothetical protein